MDTHVNNKGIHEAKPVQNPLALRSTHQITCLSGPHHLINKQLCEFTPPNASPSQNPDSTTSNLMFNRFLPINSQVRFHPPLPIFSPNISSSFTTDHDDCSPLDEVKELQLSIMDERRRRRMESNRESARRSRMRKKKQIEELQYQVDQLLTMNHQLSEKVIRLLETNQQIIQENAQLKEKVSSLHILLTDMLTPLRNVEEISCYTNHIRAEPSNQ